MGQHVLLAEPCELLRIGLRAILADNPRVSRIYEATTQDHLNEHLRNYNLDLVIINQTLITDVRHLPKGKFAILASEPDINVLKSAYKHGIRGYLSENVSAELLRVMLNSPEESLLIEPTLTPWIMNDLFGGAFSSIRDEWLTPREREIIQLLREGLDRQTIAKRLCIAETTLKTHIKNIRKHEAERYAEIVP